MIGVTPKGVEIAGWMVKANPATFDVGEDLSKSYVGEEWDWTLSGSYRLELMKPGQPCFLWVTQNGNPALASGIWLEGELTGEPSIRDGVTNTMWRDVAKGEKRSPVVPMRIKTFPKPILREELLSHPILSGLEVFTSPQMSNPQIVTPEQLSALRSDFDLTPTELDADTRWSLLEGDLLVDVLTGDHQVLEFYETSSGRCFVPTDPERLTLPSWREAVQTAAQRSLEDPTEVLGSGVDVLAVYFGGEPMLAVRTGSAGRLTVVEVGADGDTFWAEEYSSAAEAVIDAIAHLEVWLETSERASAAAGGVDADGVPGTTSESDEETEPTSDATARMGGKYDPLRAHLASLDSAEMTTTMTFAEIDALVGGLPASARRIRQWWANDSKIEARAWRAAGWHVDSRGVDLNASTVRFARGQRGGSRARSLGLE